MRIQTPLGWSSHCPSGGYRGWRHAQLNDLTDRETVRHYIDTRREPNVSEDYEDRTRDGHALRT